MMSFDSSRQLFTGVFEDATFDRIPIWFMRQAGRYLPEYMELRKNSSFETRVQSPELAAKITLQPIRRFDLDAAVIFSDILVPLYSMDRGLQIIPEKGPVIASPVRTPEDVVSLQQPNPEKDFPYLADSIKLVRKEIPDKAIIGFSGAPFTLASYLIEGQSTKSGVLTRGFAYQNPEAYAQLMLFLTEVIIEQLQAQIDAGADVVQIFDSWAGFLSAAQFKTLSYPYLKKICDQIIEVPKIFFSRGSQQILPVAKDLHVDGFSIDTSLTLKQARDIVGPEPVLQGNLDPAFLLSNPLLVTSATQLLLDDVNTRQDYKYIFNLGTGIDRHSSLENVEAMVKTVKAYRRH